MLTNKFSTEQLCEIYEKLNNYEWPDFLPKPDNYDRLADYPNMFHRIFRIPTKHDYIQPIMNHIKEIVPEKVLARHYHLHILGSTDDEFERFWLIRDSGIRNPKILEYFSRFPAQLLTGKES